MKNLFMLISLILALNSMPAEAGVLSATKHAVGAVGHGAKKVAGYVKTLAVEEAKAFPHQVVDACAEAFIVIKIVPLALPYLLGL